VNPHFGRPVAERIRELQRRGLPVRHLAELSDERVGALMRGTRFCVLPSLAEGCGLPVLESLWSGVPVICSDVPALAESAEPGGCQVIPTGDGEALLGAMRTLLTDEAAIQRLASQACTRSLTTWAETARGIMSAL
jgi:glycosyltransferase involved in cell wall biosynthesis